MHNRFIILIGAAFLILVAAPILALAGTITANPVGDDVLAWEPSKGAIGYIIYYGQSAESLNFKRDVGNVTQFAIRDLDHIDSDYPWIFSVSAYAFNVESDKSVPILWGENGRPYSINWESSASHDVIGYRVYMADREGNYSDSPICDTEELSCDTPILMSGETYRFKIITYDHAGNLSGGFEIVKQISGEPSNRHADTTPPTSVNNAVLIME